MTTQTVAPLFPSEPATAPDDGLRAARFAARHWLWDHSRARRGKPDSEGRPSSLPMRHRLCGRVVQGNGAPVTIRVSTREDGVTSAGWGGVQSCGSVWACPWCSAKIGHLRQQEIAAALQGWAAVPEAGEVVLMTLTMRHRHGQRLASLWDALSGSAWRRVTTGGAWASDQLVAGVEMDRVVKSGKNKGQVVTTRRVPWVRAVEVTTGPNGWHVHVHVLVFLRAGITTEQETALFGGVWRRWRDGLVSAGLEAPSAARGGFDVRPLDLGDGATAGRLGEYFTKATYGAAAEVARSDMKSGRRGNRTPMQILRDLVLMDTGEVFGPIPEYLPDLDRDDDFGAWEEWERASHGRRQITWAQGFRALLALGEERTDEELAEDDETAGEVHVQVEPAVYRSIVTARHDYLILRLWITDRRAALVLLGKHEAAVDDDRDQIGRGRGKWRERE